VDGPEHGQKGNGLDVPMLLIPPEGKESNDPCPSETPSEPSPVSALDAPAKEAPGEAASRLGTSLAPDGTTIRLDREERQSSGSAVTQIATDGRPSGQSALVTNVLNWCRTNRALAVVAGLVVTVVIVIGVTASTGPSECEQGVSERFPEVSGTSDYDEYVDFCESYPGN